MLNYNLGQQKRGIFRCALKTYAFEALKPMYETQALLQIYEELKQRYQYSEGDVQEEFN